MDAFSRRHEYTTQLVSEYIEREDRPFVDHRIPTSWSEVAHMVSHRQVWELVMNGAADCAVVAEDTIHICDTEAFKFTVHRAVGRSRACTEAQHPCIWLLGAECCSAPIDIMSGGICRMGGECVGTTCYVVNRIAARMLHMFSLPIHNTLNTYISSVSHRDACTELCVAPPDVSGACRQPHRIALSSATPMLRDELSAVQLRLVVGCVIDMHIARMIVSYLPPPATFCMRCNLSFVLCCCDVIRTEW
jgi:hypothetical protein